MALNSYFDFAENDFQYLTDQNSVPGNSGDGSSNTDDNGNMYTE